MKVKTANILFTLSILLLFSCSIHEKETTKKSLAQELEINGIKMNMIFCPAQTNESFNNSNNLNFILRISADNKNLLNSTMSKQNQADLIKKLSFEMSNYVKITNSDNQIFHSTAAVYSNVRGLMPYTDVLLVFNKKEIDYKKTEWLKINVVEWGLETGDCHFEFQKKDIEKILKI